MYVPIAIQDISHDKEVALVWLDSDEVEEPTQQRVAVVAHVLHIVGQDLCMCMCVCVYVLMCMYVCRIVVCMYVCRHGCVCELYALVGSGNVCMHAFM